MDLFDGLFGKSDRKGATPSQRVGIAIQQNYKCWNKGCDLRKVRYVIHHKDGNHSNKKLSNLVAVCPNCHSDITAKH